MEASRKQDLSLHMTKRMCLHVDTVCICFVKVGTESDREMSVSESERARERQTLDVRSLAASSRSGASPRTFYM